ncbi:hypothetical protein VTH06DRAFT_3613 [Thermothelomyces fergusii]
MIRRTFLLRAGVYSLEFAVGRALRWFVIPLASGMGIPFFSSPRSGNRDNRVTGCACKKTKEKKKENEGI